MAYKRAHVFYSGRVQGVGFRYTVRNIASEYGLSGWVKNLRDGRVEAVCEGEEKDIKIFLDSIAVEFSRYATDIAINWETPTREFKGFRITF
ncbi:MAG: acylphosphatase [Candidatus Omnitrophota bacterium]